MIRQFLSIVAVVAIVLAVAGCGSDTYESVSRDIDDLLASQIQLTSDDDARVATLRAKADELHREGKSEESVKMLKEARQIIQTAKDADLLRKSEG